MKVTSLELYETDKIRKSLVRLQRYGGWNCVRQKRALLHAAALSGAFADGDLRKIREVFNLP